MRSYCSASEASEEGGSFCSDSLELLCHREKVLIVMRIVFSDPRNLSVPFYDDTGIFYDDIEIFQQFDHCFF